MSHERPTQQGEEPFMDDKEMAAREAEAARLLEVDPRKNSRFNLEDMAQITKDPEQRAAMEKAIAEAKSKRNEQQVHAQTMSDAAKTQRLTREADEERRIALQAKLTEEMPREKSPINKGPAIQQYLEYAQLAEQEEARQKERKQRAAETVIVNPPKPKLPFWKRWFN